MQRSLTLRFLHQSQATPIGSDWSTLVRELRPRDSARSAYARIRLKMSSARLESEFSVSTGSIDGAKAIASVRPLRDIQCQAGHHDGQTWEECSATNGQQERCQHEHQPDVTPCWSWLCNTCTNEGHQDASKIIASGNKRNCKTMMGAMQLRRTCFHRNPWCTSTRNNGCST